MYCTRCTAQDVLLKVNGERINVKLLEIHESKVVYQKNEDKKGVNISLSTDKIQSLTHEDGTIDYFVVDSIS